MADGKADKRSRLTVELTLSALEGRKTPAVRVYLFDAAQRLVSSQPAKDKVEFEIDPKQRYRVTVGPDLVDKREAPPADLNAQLVNSGAISRDYSPLKPAATMSISVRDNLIPKWAFVCINIHGTVRKQLNPGATPATYAPVCTGIVEIFTIDLACSLGNLSDAALLAIKNQTLARMLNVAVEDLAHFDFSDFAKLSSLGAGLAPLTGQALRNYIVAHRAELASFMCFLIPEWAICYQQLPDAAIQSDGSFSLDYCFLFSPPDLYFEVKQTIDGVEREVADPDIMCTTMWRYDGSQGALVTVEDPAAIACQPAPKPGPGYLYVWPTAIGNIDLRQVNGLETMGPVVGKGLLPGDTPWGGTLCLQVQFDPNLRANDIHYYRWSYKFDGDADFTQINASVTHRWQEITFGPGGKIDIHLHPVTLGPRLVNGTTNLFEIPDPAIDWINIVDPSDRPFAYFDSTAGQTPGRSGLVTLKLEMFHANGTHVACGNDGHGGPFQFLLPDLGGTPDDYTNAPAANIDANGDLGFQVLVDNNPTTAQLPGVDVNNIKADDCGILHYSSAPEDVDTQYVHIQYVATHPHNYLDWSLSVSRGLHGSVASTGGSTSSANPDHFDKRPSALLGTCKQAAFAVNLNTYARAQSGYGRQSQYDRWATIAFALLTP